MTRNRADPENRVTNDMVAYYAQRASAGLVVCEGTAISPEAIAYPGVPGIWRKDQVRSWKKVTDVVHQRGGIAFLQLWHAGRVSHPSLQPEGRTPVAPSAVPVSEWQIFTKEGLQDIRTPRPLTLTEIQDIVRSYASAAENALKAGFDGVEIHAANGYLIDQFLNSSSNRREDEYGGSSNNRTRFLREVTEAVVDVCGSDRVGLRLSPSATWMDCYDDDKRGLYREVVKQISSYGLAYLHLIEPTVSGAGTVSEVDVHVSTEELSSLFDGPVIATGEHSAETGNARIQDGVASLIGFGRTYIANPDLPERLAAGAKLNAPISEHFYGGTEIGYLDYPTVAGELKLQEAESLIASGEQSAETVIAGLQQSENVASWVESGSDYALMVLLRKHVDPLGGATPDSAGLGVLLSADVGTSAS